MSTIKKQSIFEESSKQGIRDFFNFSIDAHEEGFRNTPSERILKRGNEKALRLFHETAERVPAYKDFLSRHGVEHEHIRTLEDYKHVPETDKENYVAHYDYKQRLWDGETRAVNLMAVSSGTTGEPTKWMRNGYQDYNAAIIHELIYKYIFSIDTQRTLLIIGFPMGMYVSGVATLLPSWLVSEKGYDMTVVSPGNNKNQALQIIKAASADFQQILLCGHPFFIKDVIESGVRQGVAWRKIPIRFVMASEGFSESWREYVLNQVGVRDALSSAISLYGTSDMLIIGFETPLSIALRRMFEKNHFDLKGHFRDRTVPNIFQYNPEDKFIEVDDDGSLVFTSNGSAPLIRYKIHDRGGVIEHSKVHARLLESPEYTGVRHWKLPFVYLDGRSDNTVILNGANVYPQHIHNALDRAELHDILTGKFALQKRYDKNMNAHLDIYVERTAHARKKFSVKKLTDTVHASLIKMNSEYADAYKHASTNIAPRLYVKEYQDTDYFPVGVKPKYILPTRYE